MAKKRSKRKKLQRESTKKFTKISDLLENKIIVSTIKKGLKDEDRKIQTRRTDLLEQEKLYQRSLRKQKERRDIMLRIVAQRQARLSQQSRPYEPDKGFEDSKIDRVCNSRRDRRVTLFAKEQIGKGKGSGKKRTYNKNSKIKC